MPRLLVIGVAMVGVGSRQARGALTYEGDGGMAVAYASGSDFHALSSRLVLRLPVSAAGVVVEDLAAAGIVV